MAAADWLSVALAVEDWEGERLEVAQAEGCRLPVGAAEGVTLAVLVAVKGAVVARGLGEGAPVLLAVGGGEVGRGLLLGLPADVLLARAVVGWALAVEEARAVVAWGLAVEQGEAVPAAEVARGLREGVGVRLAQGEAELQTVAELQREAVPLPLGVGRTVITVREGELLPQKVRLVDTVPELVRTGEEVPLRLTEEVTLRLAEAEPVRLGEGVLLRRGLVVNSGATRRQQHIARRRSKLTPRIAKGERKDRQVASARWIKWGMGPLWGSRCTRKGDLLYT